MRKGLVTSTLFLLICITSFSVFSSRIMTQSVRPDLSLGDTDIIWSYMFGTNDSMDAAYSIIPIEDGGCLLVGLTQVEGTVDVLIIRLNETGELEWSVIPTSPGLETARKVIECESGGFAIIGYSQEEWAQGTALGYNAYLIRIADNGTLLWTQTIGTEVPQQAYSIVECQDGGFAFAGSTTNPAPYDLDFWLVRTSSEGQPLWNQTFGGLGNQIAYSLVETHTGGFVIVGSNDRFSDGDLEGWILCTDNLGNFVWDLTFGGPRDDVCYEVIRSSSHSYVVVGTTEKIVAVDVDAFVLNIHSGGEFVWNTTLGGPSKEEAYSIASCQNGGFALTGSMIEETHFGERTHLWIARLDSYGNLEWEKRYGGEGVEIGRAITESAHHDFFITGTTETRPGQGLRTNVLVLCVPDNEQEQILFEQVGPPNFELIALGIISGTLLLAGMSIIYFSSKREISTLGIGITKKHLRKTFFLPRTLEEVTLILSGIIRCRSCGSIVDRRRITCPTCSAQLHRCLFCDNTIHTDALVIFCPNCRNLSHAHEMLTWLKKSNKCPYCQSQLKTP